MRKAYGFLLGIMCLIIPQMQKLKAEFDQEEYARSHPESFHARRGSDRKNKIVP